MSRFATLDLSRKWPALIAAGLFALASHPSLAAGEPDAPKGAAVTVLKAAKSCFANTVEVSGIVIPREETAVRPERQGLDVAELPADAGDTATSGETLELRVHGILSKGLRIVSPPIARSCCMCSL